MKTLLRKRTRCLVVLVMCLAALFGSGLAQAFTAPKNVILLIGDGMGVEHIKAAGLYANGKEGSLFLETLGHAAQVVTAPAKAPNAPSGVVPITDSAAAATAMATGHKVYNGVISIAVPGDGQPYPTVLEAFTAAGKMTGLVSTAYITDATPAAFGSHTASRGSHADIVQGYLKTTRPNVIMGGGDTDPAANLTPEAIKAAGYQVVTDRKGMAAIKPLRGSHVFGLFGQGNLPYEADKVLATTRPPQASLLEMPSLSEMADHALKIVSTEPNGFFLMIEGGLIDKAAHGHDLPKVLQEMMEFDKTVKLVMDWASKREDTLVIVVADHETGGPRVVKDNGKDKLPDVTWSTSNHTGSNVPLYVWGVGAQKISGTLDNTDLHRLMLGTFAASPATPVPGK